MPPAAPLIAIAASIAIKALELGVIATIVLTTVVNIAVGFLANALQPKPPRPNLPDLSGFATRSQQRTQQVRQAITAWRYVYGGLRLSGPITFIQSTNDNKFLHIVVTLACHATKGAWAYQLNEDVIYPDELDGDGLATAGKYDGKARLQLDTGSSGQPFSDLVSEASDWTSDHKQSGHTKIYARLEFDRDLFPSQVPNISVWLRGKSDVTDTRDSSTKYTVNPALCLRDYMLTSETEGGLGASSDEVNDTFVSSAANTNEEFVTTTDIDHTVSGVASGSLELSGDRLEFQDGDRVQVTTTGTLPAIEPRMVTFDGTNDYLTRGGDLTGLSNGKALTMAFTVSFDTDGSEAILWASGGGTLDQQAAVEDLLSAVSVDADGTRFNSSGTLVDATLDTLRRDHDPSDDSFRGVLFEAEIDELLEQTEDLSVSPWIQGDSQTHGLSSPDGGNNATQLTETSDNSNYRVQQVTHVVKAGETYKWAIWLRNDTPATVRLMLARAGSGPVELSDDLVELTTDWQRFSVSHTFANDQTGLSARIIRPGSGTRVDTIEAFGGSLRKEPALTSYVPRETAAVTRSGDTASLSRTPGSARGGYVKFRRGKGTGVVWQRDDTTANERETLEIDASGNAVFTVVDGGSAVASLTLGAAAEDTEYEVAFSVEADDVRAQMTGGTLQSDSDTSGAVPSCTTIRYGSDESGASQFGGWLLAAHDWDKRLSDSRIAALAGGTVETGDAVVVMDFATETYLTRAFAPFEIRRLVDDTLQFRAENASGAEIARAGSTSTVRAADGLTHVLLSLDLAQTDAWMRLDDAAETLAVEDLTDDTIDLTQSEHSVGAGTTGEGKLDGDLGGFWLNDEYFAETEANRRKFVDANAHQVEMGADGSGPGAQPLVYLAGDESSFATNLGTGGGFTENGDLTDAGTQPTIDTGTNYYPIVVKHRSNADNSLAIDLASSYDDALAGTAVPIVDSGSGTHTVTKKAEPRYTLNGIVETDRQPRDVITDMLSAMGADMPYVGGAWNMIPAAFTTPTITLDEDDLRGPVTIQTRVSRKERFNAVKGVYASPLNDGVPTDYPAITNSTYQNNDGGRRVFRDLDLPMTSRPHTAQRLAKITLEKMRQEITASMPCKLTAFQVQAGDYVKVDNDRMGWAEKVFFVEESTFAEDRDDEDNPYLGIDLKLRESASAVFDWNSGEETAVDPAPNTNLPNPFTVGSPTGLVVTTEFVNGEPRIVLSWTPPADAYVVQDGDFQVTFRRANGLSLSFDGSDDHVTFNSAIDFDSAGSPGSEFAVECNVNWDGATGADQTIWTNGQLRLFRRNSDSKVVATLFSAGSPTVTASAVSTAALSANAWTHVAATWDGGTLRLLVDGTEDDTAAFSDTLASVVGPDMGRGDGVTRDTAYWSGRIDDFRVWDRRRTQTQISSNRTAALQGNETGLILYWPMDMASEQFVIDRTSVGNFGTLEGPSYDEGTITPNWEPSFSVDGSEAQAFIAPVEDGVPYDMRVRSRNHVGAVSSWSSLFGYTVGSPAEGATSIDDEGLFSEPEDRPSEDEGAFTQTVTQVEDEGAFV